jgi:hypothetical protein
MPRARCRLDRDRAYWAGEQRSVPLRMLELALAVAVSVIAAYQWTGLARYWFARTWTTAFAATLWLAWLYI